jgi:hypothetical protein
MDAKRAALTQMIEGGGGAPSGITSNSRWARVSPAEMSSVQDAAETVSGALGKAAHLGGMGLIAGGVAENLQKGDLTDAALEAAYLLPVRLGGSIAIPISSALSTGSGPSLNEGLIKAMGSARPVSDKEERKEVEDYRSGKKESFWPETPLDVSKLSDQELLTHYKNMRGISDGLK